MFANFSNQNNINTLKHILMLFFLCLNLNSCNTIKQFTIEKNQGENIINGRVSKSDFMGSKVFSWFDKEYKNYTINPDLIAQLKLKSTNLKILIFGGTWCDETQRELPRFIKIIDEIGIQNSSIEMYMLDRKKQCNYFNVSIFNVTNVPTFIFFQNGIEIGRIIESPKKSLEEDMIEIFE